MKLKVLSTPLFGILFLLVIVGAAFLFSAKWSTSSQQNSQIPNKLIVSRPEDKIDHLPTLTKTITDISTVQQLYKDIYSLPTPTSGILNCPIGSLVTYNLEFLHDNILILHGELNPTGCQSIQLNGKENRTAFDGQFSKKFQQILGLSDKEFYGDQN